MTVGIPGAGIGGLFYLACALWMPFREVWALLRGRSSPSRRLLAARQWLMALGILAAMWSTAWLIETALKISVSFTAGQGFAGGQSGQDIPRILTYSAFWIGIVTLTTVYMSMHIARLFVSRSEPAADAGTPGILIQRVDVPDRRPEHVDARS